MMASLVMLSSAIQVLMPRLIGAVIDGASLGRSLGDLYFLAAIFVAGGVAVQVLGVTEAYLGADLGQLATNSVRADVTRHLLTLDREFFASNSPGTLIERVDGDTALLSGLFGRLTLEVAQGVLILSGVLVMTASTSPLIAAILVVILLLAWGTLRAGHSRGSPIRIARQAASADLFGFIEERIAGIDDTRAGGAVKYAQGRLEAYLNRWFRATFRSVAWNGFAGATITIAVGAMLAAVFVIGGFGLVNGTLSPGNLIALVAWVDILRRPVEAFGRQAQELGQAAAGASRLAELLALRSSRASSTNSTNVQFEDHGGNWAEGSAPLGISMENVTFTYENGEQPAVSNLTFELPPGGFLAVVGHTGSGKTTLGRLIAREVETGRGIIKIGSRDAWVDLATVPEVQLRRMVAVVNQDVALFHASVRDNVTMFDPEVPDAAVMSALDRVGLGPWLASLPDGVATHLSPAGGREQSHGRIGGRVGTGGLSAGESQLLALARVFLGNARLVVLDEPAARIDPVTEVRLIDALDALARDRTVMVIAHRPSTIGHASHVAVMEAGCLVAFGPSNDPAVSRFIAPGVAPDIATDPAPMTPVTVARNKAPTDTDIGFGPSDSTTTDRSATVSVWPVLGGLIRAMTWWWLGSVVMAGFVGYVIGLVPGLVIREFLDAASSMARGGDPSPLIWLGALIFLFGVGRGIHMAITATIEPTTQTMGSGMLIAACFSGVMQSRRYPALPGSPGEAVSRFRDDTLVIGRFATWLGDPFGQLALGVGAFVVLWSRDPQVAVASVAPIVLAMVVSQAASGPVQRARQAAQAGVASVTDLLGDVFAGAAVIAMSRTSEHVIARVQQHGDTRRRAALREVLLNQSVQALSRNVATLASGVALIVSVPAIIDGRLTSGDVGLTLSYVTWLAVLAGFYGDFVLQFRQARVALARLGELVPDTHIPQEIAGHRLGIWEPAKGANRQEWLPVETGDNLVSDLAVCKLTFSFPARDLPNDARKPAIAAGIFGATFRVRAGSFTVVIGRAGSGKTTLLRTLMGLLPASSGSIAWNGVEVPDPGSWFVPPRAGYVAQVPRLFTDTVRANILSGTDPALLDLDARLASALHLATLDRDIGARLLSLSSPVGPRGLRISGGQAQRVGVARMLVTRPSLLVVDDLSSALDEATEAELWSRLISSGPVTIVASSNRPNVIEMADQVIEVVDGRCRVIRGSRSQQNS